MVLFLIKNGTISNQRIKLQCGCAMPCFFGSNVVLINQLRELLWIAVGSLIDVAQVVFFLQRWCLLLGGGATPQVEVLSCRIHCWTRRKQSSKTSNIMNSSMTKTMEEQAAQAKRWWCFF